MAKTYKPSPDNTAGNPKAGARTSNEIARWRRHRFRVARGSIRGFRDMNIKGGSETEDKTGNKQKFVSRKNSKPAEVSLTAVLDARLGCKVKDEALAFVNQAYSGLTGYLYFQGKKLMTWKLMLTEATVKDIVLSPKGDWIGCNVALQFKQSSQKNGSTDGKSESSGKSGGGHHKKSTRRKGTKTGKSPTATRVEGKSGHVSVPARYGPGSSSTTTRVEGKSGHVSLPASTRQEVSAAVDETAKQTRAATAQTTRQKAQGTSGAGGRR